MAAVRLPRHPGPAPDVNGFGAVRISRRGHGPSPQFGFRSKGPIIRVHTEKNAHASPRLTTLQNLELLDDVRPVIDDRTVELNPGVRLKWQELNADDQLRLVSVPPQ